MLRITQQQRTDGAPEATFLTLEGRLVGAWVAELSRVAGAARPGALRIDLGGVGFADEAGVRLLRELRRGGAQLLDASGFVAAVIGEDDGQDGQRG